MVSTFLLATVKSGLKESGAEVLLKSQDSRRWGFQTYYSRGKTRMDQIAELMGKSCKNNKSFRLPSVPEEDLGVMPMGYVPPWRHWGGSHSPCCRAARELFPVMGKGDQWLRGINTESPESRGVPARFAILQRGMCGVGGGRQRAVVCLL